MPDTHETLQAYLQKLLSIQDKLTPQDLRRLAREMGLSEREWQLLQDECQDHVQRGMGFVRYQNWDDAIAELNQAHAINPLHPEALDGLAQAHQARWQTTGRESDREKAISFANKLLQEDPRHEASLQRISELKQPAMVHRKISAFPLRGLAVLILGLLIALGGGLALFLAPMAPEELAREAPEVVLAEREERPVGSDTPPRETRVEMLPHAQSDHLSLVTRLAELNPYSDSYSLKFRGLLEVKELEVSELELTFEAFDAAGNRFLSETREMLGDHEPMHRSGDFIPLGWDAFEKASPPQELAELRISVSKLHATPAVPSTQYKSSPLRSYTWAEPQPRNVDLEIRERFIRKANYDFGGTYAEIVWEVRNTGNVSLNLVKLQLQWLDEKGTVQETHDTYATSTSEPIIRVGETRVFGGTYAVKERKNAENYRLVVLEVAY